MGAIGTPGMAGMMHQPQHQALHVDQMEQHPAAMEQFLDHMFSFPPWPEMSTGRSSSPWEYNGAGSAIGLESGSLASLNTAQKLFKLSQTPASGAMAVSRPQGDGQDGAHLTARDNLQYATQPDDGLLGSRLPQLQALHDRSPGLGSAAAMLSPSVGSSESEGSPGLQGGGRDQSPPAIAPPTWRQPYVVGGGGVPSVPMNLGQTNGDAGNADAFLGKRGRDEADISRDSRSVTTTGLEASFPAYGVQLGQASLVRTGQQTHQQATPPSQGISSVPAVGQAYGAQPASALQQHQGQTQGVPAVAKPRVRARRGQATDPHSIAERLRRERIAERMKSLQELVPNANKTDKASMLDEIIDYVKFLQLQVKVLSMSRLGGPGAVSPLVSDIQPESASSLTTAGIGRNTGGTGPPDGLALTERQVARLMEEDMGSAMQYLQSKGLCLMPISLASAISSNGQRPQTVGTTGLVSSSSERQRSEQSVVVSSGGVAAADKARATKDSREAGVESIANMGSAEC